MTLILNVIATEHCLRIRRD